MKLVKTKLLLKYNHDSGIGVATATHLDFCKYTVRRLKSDSLWSWKGYKENFEMFLCSLFYLLFMPFLMISNGLILYPYWAVVHIIVKRKIIKGLGITYINASAEKLVKEYSKDKE
nr:MAG TPA: hypothetical protein [Caudoviricetes sp.]